MSQGRHDVRGRVEGGGMALEGTNYDVRGRHDVRGGRYDVRGRAKRGGMALEGEGVSSHKKVRQIAGNITTVMLAENSAHSLD